MAASLLLPLLASGAVASAGADGAQIAARHTSPDSLAGLWTRVPRGHAAAHDALRVSASGAAACEHGGWLNMTALSCPWQKATLQLSGASSVTLTV